MSPTPPASPTDTPNNIGAARVPNCPDGYTATYDPWWTVVGPGTLDGFDLILDQETYTEGEQLVATLRNVTDETKTSGNKDKVDIQYHGSNGWHTIFGVDEDQFALFTHEEVSHQPAEGHTWEVTLSKTGLAIGDEGGLPSFLHACHPIKPGQYRFVYWGIGGEDEAIAVPFRVVREQD